MARETSSVVSEWMTVHPSSSDTHLFFRGLRRRKVTPENVPHVSTMNVLDTHRRTWRDLRLERHIQIHIHSPSTEIDTRVPPIVRRVEN